MLLWLAYQSTGVIYGDIGWPQLPLQDINNSLLILQAPVPSMSTPLPSQAIPHTMI